MPTSKMAATAIAALSDPNFTGIPGYCQMFVREVAEATGEPYKSAMDTYRAGSAVQTMMNFQPTAYNIWENVGKADDSPDPGFLLPGDVIYKGRATSGPFGHTGIFIGIFTLQGQPPLPCVAENSSYHIDPNHMGGVSGAKGIRTLSAFGPFEMVVRLTETEA